MLSHAWAFPYESAFSRKDPLSYLCLFRHRPFHVWIYLFTYGLTLSPMLSHTWAYAPMNLPSHVFIDSLTYAFSRMSLSPMNILSHVWIDSLSSALSRTSLLTYESTFTHMDWLSQLCFLTHEPSHLWIYLLTYGVTSSPLLSQAWAFSPMNLTFHIWIDSLTYAFSRMSLLT